MRLICCKTKQNKFLGVPSIVLLIIIGAYEISVHNAEYLLKNESSVTTLVY